LGDALRHLVIQRLAGRDVDPRRRLRRHQGLGVSALARARAAEHQRDRRAHDVRRVAAQGPGTTPPTQAANPTPTIAAPARRGISSDIPALMRRATIAVPSATTLWMTIRPSR